MPETSLTMKNFLVIFREPDGRTITHSEEETSRHQLNWKNWFEKYGKEGKIAGGSGLTLNGKIIRGVHSEITDEIHTVGTEIVGGFLLLKAEDLEEAAEIAKTCPIYEFDGYAEVREMSD